MMDGPGWHAWGMGWGWIIILIVLVAIIWIVFRAANQNRSINPPERQTPIDILKERYAKGEITKEEFDRRKNDLI